MKRKMFFLHTLTFIIIVSCCRGETVSSLQDITTCSTWQDRKLLELEAEIAEMEALINMNEETITRLEEAERWELMTASKLQSTLDMIDDITLKKEANLVAPPPPSEDNDFCMGNDFLRLVNGSTEAEGRLEVKLGDEWMSVCENSWRKQSAKLVCSILGYPGNDVIPVGSRVFGSANLTVMPTSGTCTQSAGVICDGDLHSHPIRLVGGPNPDEGRVEILIGRQWGMISAENWGAQEAKVVCTMLGFSGVSSESATPTKGLFGGQAGGLVWMYGLDCTGSESHLLWCPTSYPPGIQTFNVQNNEAGVICNNWFYHPVRLVNGTNDHEGRVEIRISGQWSSIYSSNWDRKDAMVVCRMLGYKWEDALGFVWNYGGTGQQLMGYVNCLGTEEHLLQCPNTYAVGLQGWNYHNSDAGVRCSY